MKPKHRIPGFLWMTLFVINFWNVNGQVLKIKEVPATGKKTYELTKLKNYYVDINSSFDIYLNKDTLRSLISRNLQQNNKNSEALMAKIRTLNESSAKLISSSQEFTRSFIVYKDASDEANRVNFSKQLNQVAGIEKVFKESFVTPFPDVQARYGDLIRAKTERSLIYQKIAEETLQTLTAELDSVQKAEGVYIQFGAWIVTQEGNNSIHMNGFDEYPLGAFYEHPTLNLQLSESQKKELQDMNNVFSQNDKSYNEIFTEIGKEYGTMLIGLLGPVKKSADSILNTLAEVKRLLISPVLKEQLKSIDSSFNNYLRSLTAIIESYKTENIEEKDKFLLLMRFQNDQNNIISMTRDQFNKTKTQIEQIRNTVQNAGNELKSLLDKLDLQCSYVPSGMEKNFIKMKDGLSSMVYGAKINSDLLVFGDKVKKLAVDDIPSSTSFSLKYTGKRKPGDQVILKVGAGTASNPKPKDMEVVYLHLLDAEPHIMMAIAYDFAWPVSKIHEVPPNGPSYSILYKFRSRSPVYRNVFDFGVGLNFAAFDFNKDNIPEIASGFCISMLRDYIQGGWGFNFNANTGYYYVGLRIPLSLNSIYFSNSDKQEKQ